MPLVFGARLSTDAGNKVTFGSDGGLALIPPYGVSGGINQLYTIDNTWVGSGQALAYTLPCTTAGAAIAMPSNTAFVQPFAVARTAKPSGVSIYVSAAGAGGSLKCAVFAHDPAVGGAGAKVTDLWSIDTSASGVRTSATMLDPSFTFVGRRLYWLAMWAAGATFNVWQTSDSPAYGTPTPLGQMQPPSTTGHFTAVNARGYWDTSVSWLSQTTAPTTLAPLYTSNNGTRMVMAWWLLTNV
jgi:hypothetical protein